MATGKTLNGMPYAGNSHCKKIKLAVCAAVFAVSVAVVQAAQPIRAMSASVNKVGGIVTSFDLTFDTTPESTALYACWDAADRGAETNSWAHVEKIGDIAGDVTALNVPISRFPTWGGSGCRALRFVMEPGALFERAGTYLETTSNGGQYIDTGYMLDKTDAIDLSWTFTHISAQPNTIICGSVAYDASRNYQDHYFIRFAGSGTVACLLSKRNGSADQNTSAGASWKTAASNTYIDTNVRVRMAVSATEQSIWTNSVITSTGAVVGDEVLLAHNTQEFDADFTQQTNCFLFAWPGIEINGTVAYWPNNAQDNKFMGKIYHCDIARSGVPAVSCLPVMKDGVACFYDTVRKVFLRNIGTGSFSLSAASPDVGVATDAILYDGPSVTVSVGCPAVASTSVVSGLVESAGLQASSLDILFAYAPVGTDLPGLSALEQGLAAGDEFAEEIIGLTPGVCYAYAIDFVNDRGSRLPQPLTGTFFAGAVNAWTGPESGGDWEDDANWSQGRAPIEYDVVTIPDAVSVGMSSVTPNLSSLTVGGTLTATGWATKIAATAMTVAEGGVVTCAAGGEAEESLSRVWIVCDDLTVEAGGTVTVDGKGYGTPAKQSSGRVKGYGPGGEKDGGGAYGGYGSKYREYNDSTRGLPYGSAEEPEQAGSGGCSSQHGKGGAGGGAIRIEATGIVRVDGQLTANGATGAGVYVGCGSGGGIWVTCSSLQGSGVLSAVGGVTSGKSPPDKANFDGYAGGGGRIALHYDTSVQTAEMIAGMTITVAGGIYSNVGVNKQDRNKYRSNAEMGTLWFPDATLLKLIGTSLWGQLVNVAATPLTLDEIDMAWGQIRFADPGADVTVTGDVTVHGDSQLEIGGDAVEKRFYSTLIPVTTVPVSLTVGGDLVVTNGGRFDVLSAPTNGTTEVAGATVTVGGTLRVADASFLYCVSDSINGGSPRFAVGALDVQAGGTVSAFGRGFMEQKGPGAGIVVDSYFAGGGHGGHGGLENRTTTSGAHANDDPYLPTLAGSGSGRDTWNAGGVGGGVVHIEATGRLQVDGTITVDGELKASGGGGAGGTIFLRGKTFVGGTTGVLTAKGANAYSNGGTYSAKSGAGGGGRIAVWTGEVWDGKHFNSPRLVKTTVPQTIKNETFLGTVTVTGGYSDAIAAAGEPVSCAGGDGTAWFVHVSPQSGLIMIFR